MRQLNRIHGRNLTYAGDVREFLLMTITGLPEEDSEVWEPVNARVAATSFCFVCARSLFSCYRVVILFSSVMPSDDGGGSRLGVLVLAPF